MNFHYQYARDLGQLQPTKLFLISSGGLGSYTERALKNGEGKKSCGNAYGAEAFFN